MSKFSKPKEESVSVRSDTKRLPSILDFIDRASFRVMLLIIPVCLLTLLASLALMPYMTPYYGETVAKEIAKELKGRVPSNAETLEIIHDYGLVWLFLTDNQGAKIEATAAYSAPTRRIPKKSKSIIIRSKKYFDAVVPFGNKAYLHAGFPNDSNAIKLSITSMSSLVRPVPFGSMLFFVLTMFAIIFIVCESIASLSASLLGSTIDKLTALVNTKYTIDDVRKSIKLTWATSEFRAIGSSLFILMRQVSEVMEKKNKAEELEEKKREKRRKQARLSATGTFEKQHPSSVQETGVFGLQVERVLITSTSSYDFASKLLDSVNTIFGDIVEYAAFLKIEENGEIKIEKEFGFGSEGVELLRRIDHKELTDERSMSKRSIEIGPMQIKRLGFEHLARQFAIANIIYLPLHVRGKGVAILAIFVDQKKQLKPERVRSLENFRDKVTSIYAQITEKEELEDERWLDPVTGLGNMTYFKELMPVVLERTREQSTSGTFTIAFVGLDFSAPDLVRFPNEMRQRWLTEVGQVLARVLPVSKRLVPERGANTFLCRYQDDIIACVIEGMDISYNMTQIEGIQTVLHSRQQWAGGITKIPFSIATATYPNDGNTTEEMVRSVDRTLSYIQEMLGGSGLFNAKDVPADFTPKASTEIAGTLGVLNAADLLQSIAASENTGILQVEDELGQQFTCTWREGQPMNATLGSFQDMNAVAEFVITFKAGQYNFHQRKPTQAEMDAQSKLHSIEYCLMEAALYEDKMNAALKVIPNAGIIVRTINNTEGLEKLKNESDVTPEEISVVYEIGKLGTSGAPLEAIFKKLDHIPSFVKWRSAALMVEHGLLEWQWPTM